MRLGELAERLGVRLVGDPGIEVVRAAPLEEDDAAALGFVQDATYLDRLEGKKAGVVILPPAFEQAYAGPRLISENPLLSFARAALLLHPRPRRAGIHPSAWVDPQASVHATAWVGPLSVIERGASIAAGCQIGPHCLVGEGSQIGEETELVAHVTIMHGVRIGARCILHPGVVIGADGFGLAHAHDHWERVPQLGGVRIGDDVDIGANTTVDRGTLSDTVLADGVKIDNLVQIGHNSSIGEHTAIAGCAGLGGSSKVGRHCIIAGGTGLAGHLELADGVQVTAMSRVSRSILQPGLYSSGTPLDTNRNWRRNSVRFRHLDEMARRLDALERRMRTMENHKE